MNELIRKFTVMVNSNTPIEEIKAYHKVHGMDIVDALIEVYSTPESEAAFTTEVNALIKDTRSAHGLPPSDTLWKLLDP